MSEKYIIDVLYYDDYDTDKCWFMDDEKTRTLCGKEQLKNSNYCSQHHSQYHTDDCPICLEEFTVHDYKLEPCGHWVHLKCIYKSGKPECPLCRVKVKLTKLQESCIKDVHYDEAPGMAPIQSDEEGEVLFDITIPAQIFYR